MKTATSIWSRIADVAGLVATPLVPSHYIALVSPLSATHSRRARVEAVHDETADVRTLTLRTGRGWVAHRAGQHIRVQVAVAVREIQSRDVESGLHHARQRVGITRGGADGGNDLCAAHRGTKLLDARETTR